jgi:hypothetical protein
MKEVQNADLKHHFASKRGEFGLWAGLLLAPAAWAVQLQTVYLLTEYGCTGGSFTPVHIVSAVALAAAVFGGLLSWRHWLGTGEKWKTEKSGIIPRSRFMVILGMLLSALFSLLIFGQWLPTIMGVPCDK